MPTDAGVDILRPQRRSCLEAKQVKKARKAKLPRQQTASICFKDCLNSGINQRSFMTIPGWEQLFGFETNKTTKGNGNTTSKTTTSTSRRRSKNNISDKDKKRQRNSRHVPDLYQSYQKNNQETSQNGGLRRVASLPLRLALPWQGTMDLWK